MVSTFFSHLIKPTFGLLTFSVTSAVALSLMAAPEAYAQEDTPQQIESEEESDVRKKVIHEPIHRVPKVANSNVVPPNIVPRNITPNAKKTPAFLPSATKTLPASPMTPAEPAPTPPVDPAPTNRVPSVIPAPSKSMIPAIPASNAKPVAPTRAPHPLDDDVEIAKRGLLLSLIHI